MGHLIGAVVRAAIRERVGKEVSNLILPYFLGLLLVPPIGQTQPEARVQGTPVRGPCGSASWALSRVEKDGERPVGQTEDGQHSKVM